ncbi:hypothetical protein GCM10011452_38100 [Gemmobacter lanyuensis]|uniref:HTH marR-type domain-containing protein n=2 Tax=Gemmobacter lanyuensis TaxID=1054497 RepID=A0A918J778_9RHOB|nr:hypothetical protein GCM10011452_38100 [Gemmobacter lanyuensis]
MTSSRDTLREDVHFRVLRILDAHPEMSQRDLAKAVGISTGGIHYVLCALLEKGLIKLGKFTAAEDRRRHAYVLTLRGVAERARLTRRFLSRKMAEYEALRTEIIEVGADLTDSDLAALRAEAKAL